MKLDPRQPSLEPPDLATRASLATMAYALDELDCRVLDEVLAERQRQIKQFG
ncbi:hypothetical protein IAI31_11655, partial [Streptococcus pseudopneumoniae]|nr:hypothetical protein [Streptococcus pseudopneumoniae]